MKRTRLPFLLILLLAAPTFSQTLSAERSEMSGADARNLGSNGLRNMRSWATALGADFQIESVPGTGTTVLIKILMK